MQQKLYSRDQLVKSIDDLAGELERKDPSDKVILELLTKVARYELDESVLKEYEDAYWGVISELEKLYEINQDENTGVKALEEKVNKAAEVYDRWKRNTGYGNGVLPDVDTLCLSLRDENISKRAAIPTEYPVKPYLPEVLPQPEDDSLNAHNETVIYTDEDHVKYKDILVEAIKKGDEEKTELIADLDGRLNAYQHSYEQAQNRRSKFEEDWTDLESQRAEYQNRELRRIQLDNINKAVRKMKSVQPGGAG